MNNSIRPYLFGAVNIIRSNVSLLFIPTTIVFTPYLFMIISNKALGSILSIFSMLLLLVIYPLIYGKFIAIINDVNTVSWGQLFTLHWWNYVIVKLVLFSPIIFLSLITSFFNLDVNRFEDIISFLLDIFSIYIFPMVFITYQRLASIPLGIKCLLGNFTFSLPIILLSLLPTLTELLSRNTSTVSENPTFYFLLVFLQLIFAVVIDFTVFITASLILKEKIFPN
jgi:hypothetical protein